MSRRRDSHRQKPSGTGRGRGAARTAQDAGRIPAAVAAELAELEAALRGEPTAGDELGTLVREVRAAAPELDRAVAAELDARVAAGFDARTGRAAAARARQSGASTPVGGTVGRRRPLPRDRRGFAAWLDRLRDGYRRAPMAVATACVVVVFVVGGGLASLRALDSGAWDDAASYTELASEDRPVSAAPRERASAGAGSSAASDADSGTAATAESAIREASGTIQSAPESGGGEAAPASGDSSSTAAPGAGGQSKRAVRRSVDMTVTVDQLGESARKVDEITAAAGGYVATSQVDLREGDTGSGSYTLRLPTDTLDETLAELGELGVVTRQDRSAQDITSQLNSAERRLQDAKDERKALLSALSKATGAGEIASLRSQIDDNRKTQARLDAEVKRVQRQTTTSTVRLTLTTYDGESGYPKPDRDGIAGAFDDALKILEGIAGILIVGAAVIAPFALIGGAIAWLTARRRRTRRQRALGDD